MNREQDLKVRASLREDMMLQGARCRDALGQKDPDVIAAAITVSVLVQLRHFTAIAKIDRTMIQCAIDAFMQGAQMVERRDEYGQLTFKRVADAKESSSS
jgi:hypothetical protein